MKSRTLVYSVCAPYTGDEHLARSASVLCASRAAIPSNSPDICTIAISIRPMNVTCSKVTKVLLIKSRLFHRPSILNLLCNVHTYYSNYVRSVYRVILDSPKILNPLHDINRFKVEREYSVIPTFWLKAIEPPRRHNPTRMVQAGILQMNGND